MKKQFIKISYPILLFLMIPFVKPASLEYIAPNLEICFDVWRIISFVIIVFLYIYNMRVSRMMWIIILYEMVIAFSTVINNGDYWKLFVNTGTIIGFSMLMELSIKQNCKLVFRCISSIYFVLILVNFIVLLIYPHGIATDDYYVKNTYNFLAIDNGLAQIFIPIMPIICLYSSFRGKKWTLSSIISLSLISITMILTWSATGLVGWFIMMIYILFIFKKGSTFDRVMNIRVLYLCFVAFQIAIVFLRMQEHFAFIIEYILNKTVSFTGRTEIWDLAFQAILKHPILGYGMYRGHGVIHYNTREYYSHNGILEILTQGGMVGLVVQIAAFLIAGSNLYKYRDHYAAGIISIAVFSMLFMSITEAYLFNHWLFGLLIMAFCIPSIIEQLERENHKQVRKLGLLETGGD